MQHLNHSRLRDYPRVVGCSFRLTMTNLLLADPFLEKLYDDPCWQETLTRINLSK